MVRISVCMATYNGERFIRKQLDSILHQLSEHDEIIISDDSSSDRTIDIIKEFTDSRIFLIEKQQFRSAMLNFENAINHARGKYIFLSDQDDIWMDNKVAVVIGLLQVNDLVLSDCQVVDEKSEVKYPSFFKYRNSKPGFWGNVFKNSYVGCCMAFKSQITAYILPFPQHIHMHDWWIGLLVELKGKICFYPHPLIYYVRHGGNVSPTTDEKGYKILEQITNRLVMLFYVTVRILNH